MCRMESDLIKNLCIFSERTLRDAWSFGNFDKWLFLDAGTTFGYAFQSHIHNIFHAEDGFQIGKLCVYEIQMYVRQNKDYTLDAIVECANNYVVKNIPKLHPTIPDYEYAYFN